MIFQTLEYTVSAAESVRSETGALLTMATLFPNVFGNEPGVGGGVVSGVNKGWARPIMNQASSIRSEGHQILRHGTLMEMNCAGSEGIGNTRGLLYYMSTGAIPSTNANGIDRDKIPDIPDDMKGPHVTPPELAPWMWGTIDFNDIAHVGLAAIVSPIAVALRAASAIIPGFNELLSEFLPPTYAGTEDKTGWGILVGNHSGSGGPGVVGVSVALAKLLLSPFGSEDGLISGARFEKGQGDEGRDAKTGPGFESDDLRSFGDTVGQLLGVFFYKIGLGDQFFAIIEALFGLDPYGFSAGVWRGTRQLPVTAVV